MILRSILTFVIGWLRANEVNGNLQKVDREQIKAPAH